MVLKNILILSGSPHKNGTSSALLDRFEEGARSNGNEVTRRNVAFLNINGCLGCNNCKINKGICSQVDDFSMIKDDIRKSDVVVFATPLYYFGMSAQLKQVIDRFHSIGDELKNKKRQTILISTQTNPSQEITEALIDHYKMIINYWGWDIIDMLIATAVPTLEELIKTDYLEKAKELGERIS